MQYVVSMFLSIEERVAAMIVPIQTIQLNYVSGMIVATQLGH